MLEKKSFVPIQASIRNNIYEILTILLEIGKKVIEHCARVLPTIDLKKDVYTVSKLQHSDLFLVQELIRKSDERWRRFC